MKLKDELIALQKKWRKSKARNVQQKLEDGKYIIKIIDTRLERSKSSDRLQIACVGQVVKGRSKGRMIYWYSGLETEENISFVNISNISYCISTPS